ncbi:MAG: tryptophan--tRNA ligase [Thermofilum sp. ex4484_15]|nr:MAG: tryptophan--tRNA ligase [Thermofilum sp. ex4484_15]
MGYEEVVRQFDPWSSFLIKDYDKLFKAFGIRPLTGELISQLPTSHRLLRRRIIIGHRDLERIINAIREGEEYAVMSGIKPTGEFHLGSKLTAEEMIFFQKLSNKARLFYCIADVEAYNDNRQSLEVSSKVALNNVMDMLALGMDPRRVYVYKQSEEVRVLRLASLLSRDVTYSTIKAIYGEKSFGLYFSALIQVGDILLPQLPDFGGPKPTIVPVGVDQDPHIRLTRDLAKKHEKDYGFLLPSATYHRLVRDLTGREKMSKRNPMGMFTLTEEPESIKRKIMNAYTGGRPTVKEQRERGGNPDICMIYELLRVHFEESDEALRELYYKCKGGEVICGECKQLAVEKVLKWVDEHRKKREKVRDLAERLLIEHML